MKKLLVALCLLFSLSSLACTSSTSLGSCVGLNDDRDPRLHYRIETMNVVVGIIFVETIFVPVVVALDELYCPDRVKVNGN